MLKTKLTNLAELVVIYGVLIILIVVMVGPYLFTGSTSLQRAYSMFTYPPRLIPMELTLSNYVLVFTKSLIFRWLLNTSIFAGSLSILTIFIATLAGYAFAKMEFVGKNLLFLLVLGTLMIPLPLLLLPTFLLVIKMGMLDTFAGLIIPRLSLPLGVFFMRQFIITIPTEILDAARIDGCLELGLIWRIVFPLTTPAMGILAIFTFTGSWNDLIWPLIISRSPEMYTVSVGLAQLQGFKVTNWGMIAAGICISIVPVLSVFMLFQKHFVTALTEGALKM